MGLISGILGLPLAPLRGTILVAEQVLHQAEDEYYDPAKIRTELDRVARERESGQIDEDEATAQEDELIERLMIGNQRAREGRHG